MNEPEIKFTRRWNDYLEQYRKSARMVDGEKIEGKARFLQDSGSSSLDTSCTLVQDRKRLATLNPKGKLFELAKHVTELYLVQKHPLLKRMYRFPERRNEERRCKHAFQRR